MKYNWWGMFVKSQQMPTLKSWNQQRKDLSSFKCMPFSTLSTPFVVDVIIPLSILSAQVEEIVLLFITFKMIKLLKKAKCFYTIWEESGMGIVLIKLLLSQLMESLLRSKRKSTTQYIKLKKQSLRLWNLEFNGETCIYSPKKLSFSI